MGPNIYKPGQGYWTRVMSAIFFGLIALMGGAWLGNQIAGWRVANLEPIYMRAGAFLIVALLAGSLIYFFIGLKKRSVDFLIATEGEMKKVNWSTRREVFGMTWVVIGLTIFIAIFILIFDYLIYSPIFRALNVLET
ncbi:MAG: preprotein translocase subunit SecE [Phycisphaerales bacterium]